MQFLNASLSSRSYFFFIHFFLTQSHESIEGILDKYLHLRGRALPKSFPQQILTPYLTSDADFLLLGCAKIYPFGKGNVTIDLPAFHWFFDCHFSLLLYLLDELDSSSDGDRHDGLCWIFLSAV